MNTEQFENWAASAGLSRAQSQALASVMASAPIRSTQTGCGIRGYFPSRKMGRPVGFSSRTAEFPFCVRLEQDPEVLAYVEQPVELKVTYSTLDGKPAAHLTTPDYLALREGVGPVFYECKHLAKLEASRTATPGRFVLEGGVWRCPSAAEDAQRRFGAQYVVAVADDMSPVHFDNLLFMRSHSMDPANHDEAMVRRVIQRVGAAPGITAAELKADLIGLSLGVVWTLLNECRLYADFAAARFTVPKDVKLYPTREALAFAMAASQTVAKDLVMAIVPGGADAFVTIDAVRHSVVGVSGSDVHLLKRGTEPVKMRLVDLHRGIASGSIRCLRTTDIAMAAREMITTRTPEDIADATERYAAIADVVGARIPPPPGKRIYSPRQKRRFARLWREAERVHGFGLIGLLRRKPPGRPRDVDPRVLDVFKATIDTHYRTPVRCTALAVYPKFVRACSEAGLQPFSLRSFYHQLAKLNRYEKVLAREGPRAARKFQGPEYLYLDNATPVHGTFVWQVAHMDHTEIDLVVKCEVSGALIKRRATLTLMTLALTRRVVGFHVGFEGETTRAAFAAMRNCVARNGRLPELLVMDNGSAFRSADMAACCGALDMIKFARPPGSARGGSVLERMFGTTNVELLAQIPGNTQSTKDSKTRCDETDPYKRDDVPTLERAVAILGGYFFEVYDTRLNVALGNSPREFEKHLIEQQGTDSSGRVVADTEEFRIATSTSVGQVTVHERYGVQVHYHRYMCRAFLETGVGGTKVQVKRDDWDARVVYAHVGGRWERCVCKALSDRFGELDPRVLIAATSTLRAAASDAKASAPIKAAEVMRVIETAAETEAALLWRATQRARAVTAEMHKLLALTPTIATDESADLQADDEAEAKAYEEGESDPMRTTHVGRIRKKDRKPRQ